MSLATSIAPNLIFYPPGQLVFNGGGEITNVIVKYQPNYGLQVRSDVAQTDLNSYKYATSYGMSIDDNLGDFANEDIILNSTEGSSGFGMQDIQGEVTIDLAKLLQGVNNGDYSVELVQEYEGDDITYVIHR